MRINKDELIAVLSSGFLLYFSYPYYFFGVLSFISLIPMLILFDKNGYGFGSGFRVGYWFGLVFNALVIYWIANNILITALVAVAVNGLQYALFWGLYAFVNKKYKNISYLLFPFLWVFLEYLREFGSLQFNWTILANTLTYYIPFIQFIEYTGTLSLSFVIVTVNILFFLFRKYRRERTGEIAVAAAVALLSGLMLWSLFLYFLRSSELQNAPSLRVAVIQPNVDPWEKWDVGMEKVSMRTLLSETEKLKKDSLALVVWPETATPFYLRTRRAYLDSIFTLLQNSNMHLLTGSLDYRYTGRKEKKYDIYNSAFFLHTSSEGLQKYDKLKLVPGAEMVPFKNYLGFITKYIDFGQGDFTPGKRYTVFNVKIPGEKRLSDGIRKIEKSDKVRISAAICFDSIFPDVFRGFVNSGAEIFVIITNDGWFGLTTGPYQHFQIAVLRAIESRRSIIRSANTGISGFIDPLGRRSKMTELEHKCVIKGEIKINEKLSFYDKYPRVLPVFAGFTSILLLSYSIVLDLRKRYLK